MSSGAQTRLSGLIEGALALVAFLILGTFIAWVPIAALAGILIVIGFRMFDRASLHLLKSRATILNFAVIVTVVVVALTVSLIAPSGVGIALAIVLPLSQKQSHHLATFGRGDFFGEMAFLDPAPRSADALAFTDTDLFVLSRTRFDTLAEEHKKLAIGLVLSVARVLSIRLRYANAELRALHMS